MRSRRSNRPKPRRSHGGARGNGERPVLSQEVTSQDLRSDQSEVDQQREKRLFLRWQRFGDESAREALVERYLPLARGLARRFSRERDAREDFTQVASIGLLKAIDGFDPERGNAFTSFAVPTILGELKRHVRDFGWPVHVPRQVRDRAVRVKRAAGDLELQLGRAPSVAEVGTECRFTTEHVLEAMEATASAQLSSLTAGDGEGDDQARRWLSAHDAGYELVEDRDAIARKLRGCKERERTVLRLRLVENMSQREIGSRVGMSQMQVSRLLRRLLAELRD
jgi:RNA polymerase sigma-B factor